jgi:hypothetical protein
MPHPTAYSHEHAHTILGLARTNNSTFSATAIVAAVVAVATALDAAITTGLLKFPDAVVDFVPWIVLVLNVVLVIGAALGIGSYHPDVPNDQLHHGEIRTHD